VAPHIDDAGLDGVIGELSKPLSSDGEELRSMVQRGAGDAAGCEASSDTESLVEDINGHTGLGEFVCSDEPGEARADDGHVFDHKISPVKLLVMKNW
jgi:hypothetical protein